MSQYPSLFLKNQFGETITTGVTAGLAYVITSLGTTSTAPSRQAVYQGKRADEVAEELADSYEKSLALTNRRKF